ncbi:MAG TPA: 2-dehydropantoate 2-reductase [Nocardioidaceae bacterium]|nr:2-dehydropantoate 2-reductase [Nocardioidaceae bacterium]
MVEPGHVGIVGAGSIGSMLAAHLTLAGHPVTVVDGWFPHVEEIRGDGVEITAPDETVRVRLDAYNVDELDRVRRPLDVLLVAVKAYDSAAAVRLMSPLLHESATVVAVQNGMTEEWFARLVDPARLVGCCVHVPAELTGPGRVTRYLSRSRRAFTIGGLGGGGAEPRAQALAGLFRAAGETDVTEDLAAVKWAKLAVNTMTNAPAGITGWTTNRLWSDPESVPFVVRAAGETLTVAEATGIRADPVFGRFDPEVFRRALADRNAAGEAAEALGEMAAERTGSSESRPSLLQDVDRGRRTEVRYLNGYVVRRGREVGVSAPVNAGLEMLVEEIDRGHRRKHPQNLARLRALAGG